MGMITAAQTRQLLATKLALVTLGHLFYVDSGNSQARDLGHYGRDPGKPFATIDYAIGQCTASNGDVIVVAPGHTETISAANGIDADVQGITIIGIGDGTDKPTITLGTATTATFRINADNVRIKNLRFVNAIDSLVKFINVAEDYATIEDCELVTSSALEATSFINVTTTKDFVTIRGCRFEQPTDPAGTNGGADTGAIYVVDTEHILVENCTFRGNFETACLHNRTTACKYLTWRNNTVSQELTDAARIILVLGAIATSNIGPDTDFVAGRGYPVRRATAAPPGAAATTPYFTITGGTIDIMQFEGEVTTAFATGGGASSLKFQANPTAAGSSVDICAALDVNTEAVNTLFGITGTFATALQAGLAIIGQTVPVRAQIGTIDATMATTTLASGSAKWTLWWKPVDLSLGVPNVYAA